MHILSTFSGFLVLIFNLGILDFLPSISRIFKLIQFQKDH